MILDAIYRSPYGKSLVFLGGTCLRIAYKSGRFSEDLDFDNLWLAPDDWEKMGDLIVGYLQAEGLIAEKNTIYKWAFHCYIRIPEVLQDFWLSPHHDEKILIQIDTVAQGFSYTASRYDLDAFDIHTPIRVTPSSLLLSQKIRAAYERKRTKWRDFYDIRFLESRGIVPDFDYLDAKMGIKNDVELTEFMREKNKTIDFPKLARDVEPFLFRSQDVEWVRGFGSR